MNPFKSLLRLGAVALALALIAALSVQPASALSVGFGWYTANLASKLTTLPANTTQVVIVHAANSSTTYATLETFTKVNGQWRPAFGGTTARIGELGFSDNHVEGRPTTPTGVYSFGATIYGVKANPGVRFAYHVLVAGDYWDENSASPGYNTFHHGLNPGGPSEALWTIKPAYNYFAVINYNVPAVPNKGSGIFLHVGTGGPTAGCVSLGEAALIRVLRWLDPAASPRIVMATNAQLSRY
jgi:L,D-peptidoglycan transpeptidase YkuD (ErfK/YbiS/YcfS/YnhG family)